MNVAWAMLANYAADAGGLLNIQGASWDTVTVASPLPDAPENVFAALQGYYVARLAFHQTEANRNHRFEIVVVDEDAQDIARVEGEAYVGQVPGLPASWKQHVNLVIPLNGLPIPRPGIYRINLLLDGIHQDELEFRVVKAF